jgi:hypothetical protein
MHQIIFLTALTATSGLFGGGRPCAGGRCGVPTQGYAAYAPSYAPSYGCQPGTACAAPAPQAYGCQPGTACAVRAPQAPVYAPQAPAYAPTQAYAPAPAVQAPRAAFYPSSYYPSAPACAGGACYRR